MYRSLASDTQGLIKAMTFRSIELQDGMPTGRARAAPKGRETAHLRHHFLFVLQHALSQGTRCHHRRQGMIYIQTPQLPTNSEAAEAPPGPAHQRRPRNDDGDLESGEPQNKCLRATASSKLSGSSNIWRMPSRAWQGPRTWPARMHCMLV